MDKEKIEEIIDKLFKRFGEEVDEDDLREFLREYNMVDREDLWDF